VNITFLGANRQVTGSRYCLESSGLKVLVDCGMFQERAYLERNWQPSLKPPRELAAVLLTHVHIDHSGLLPRLVREGFRGPIYCTRPTAALAEVMLLDAARIQEEDAAYKKKRHQREGRRGKYPEIPLFTEADARRTLGLLQGVPYGKPIAVDPRLQVAFHDAGHILGSAILQVDLAGEQGACRILFSGDLGQWGKPIVRDPTLLTDADYVVLESTYGDRLHDRSTDIPQRLTDLIHETFRRGGNLVIPTFAVERAQELMYHIGGLAHAGRIPDVPVFVDSPMAVDVTEIFQQFPDCYDEETWRRMSANEPPLRFPGLHLVRSVDESRAINARRGPSIIMSASGMCTEGRIKHHLRQNIERPESTILFVGFQAQGTLGRRILDGDPEVRIHGRSYRVRARIEQLSGFSAHGDQQDLLRWVGNLRAPRRIFLTHGEEQAARALSEAIRARYGWEVSIPQYADQFAFTPPHRPESTTPTPPN
jgi:metallo-beta-lactamase family protein